MSGRGNRTPTEIRCAIYTRKSTEEGLDQQFNSLDAQREASEAFITSQKHEGWVIIPDRYDDGGFSGGTMERPALKQLMDDIAAKKIDCVVVYKVDRLSRSLLDFSRVMETFDQHGVSFVSVTQQFNTTHSMGRLTLNILLSFAQFEREIIGERIRDKLAAQCKRGQWTGGFPVLGYDVDRSERTPKLVVNGEEAARVRCIFSLYLEIKSLGLVCDELAAREWKNKAWRTKKGVPKGGREFDKAALHSLLTNPLYAGKIRHKGTIYQGQHEAIIAGPTFERVQSQLRANNNSRGNRMPRRTGGLLKGLLRCPDCNVAMSHNTARRGTRCYRYYTCTRAIKRGRKVCTYPSLPAGEIEAAVVDQVRRIITDDGLRREIVRQAADATETQRAELEVERQQLCRQLARDHAEIHRLTDGRESAAATRIADLQDRIERTERQLVDAEQRLAELERVVLTPVDVADALDDFDRLWQSLTQREQAELLQLLVAKVEFDQSDCTLAVSFHSAGIQSLENQQTGEAA